MIGRARNADVAESNAYFFARKFGHTHEEAERIAHQAKQKWYDDYDRRKRMIPQPKGRPM